jgi:hypothetical protein
VEETSVGERIVARFLWFLYDAGSRPVAVAAVLAVVGVTAVIAAGLTNAWTLQDAGFTDWINVAAVGFSGSIELLLLFALLLLVIDARSGDPFPGRQPVLVIVAVLAVAGVAANITQMVVLLHQLASLAGGVGNATSEWTAIVTTQLSTTVLATITGWVAVGELRGGRDES